MHLVGREFHAELSTRFDAVVIGPDSPADVEELAVASVVTLAGGRIVAVAALADAARRIAEIGSRPVVLLEARDVPEDELVGALSRLDGLLAGRDLPLIVGIAADQIDIVAAGLILSPHQILCDPRPSDWIGAIAAAQGAGGLVLHDRVNDGEAARLAKLNAEVARIADVLARLSKHDEPSRVTVVAETGLEFAAEQNSDHAIAAADIRQIVRARRLRDRYV